MSQVDYEQKIREIKKLKISADEKSRRICALTYKAKAKPAVKHVHAPEEHVPFHDQIHTIQTDSSLSIQEKQDKMKVLIEERRAANAARPNVMIANVAPHHQSNDSDQIHAIQTDSSLGIQEKQDKMKALMEERRAARTNVVNAAAPPHQLTDPFGYEIHIIQTDSSLSIQEKQDKMKALMEERRRK